MSQKKSWSASAKFKIALAAVKEAQTIAAICQDHQVAPSQVHAWRKQLLEGGSALFEGSQASRKKKAAQQQAALEAALYAGIASYIRFYNMERWHPSLNDETPYSVYTDAVQIPCG